MKRVKEFLELNWDGDSDLLLGYSGGPDSKALLYTLIECGLSKYLHVAHVDHGWREESLHEAEAIQKEVEGLGLPFYLERVNSQVPNNKEDSARKLRLQFFMDLYEKHSFSALLLAHQADELAETALKRIFEGAHLSMLGGMKDVSYFKGMRIWRPLLKTRKRKILDSLQGRPYFSDPTNRDPQYLRSRMREEMFPFLDRSFGKGILGNLCRLSESSYELKQYLDQNVAHCDVREGSFGIAICCKGLEKIEMRHLIQQKNSLTKPVLETLIDWVDDRLLVRQLYFQGRWIASGRGWVIHFLAEKGRLSVREIRELMNSFNATN